VARLPGVRLAIAPSRSSAPRIGLRLSSVIMSPFRKPAAHLETLELQLPQVPRIPAQPPVPRATLAGIGYL